MKCPLCGEEVGTKTDILYHLNKTHHMVFGDVAEMDRRLKAVGIDIDDDQPSQQLMS